MGDSDDVFFFGYFLGEKKQDADLANAENEEKMMDHATDIEMPHSDLR